LEPVGHCLTPEGARELVNLQADDVVQARLEELADKCTEGELSAEEKIEYETYVRAIEFIGVLQAHARRMLSATPA
jgi:ubiquinone biosynthesis protein COQ9